jgi:hypothetical protein
MKLGVAVDNLGASQLNYLFINQVNKYLENNIHDVIAFYEDACRPCMLMRFAAIPLVEAWSFNGTIISTSLSTTQKLLRLPGVRRRLFMVWDLEWLREPRPFEYLNSIYRALGIELLCRTPEHQKILSDIFQKPVSVVGDFDLNLILAVISNE